MFTSAKSVPTLSTTSTTCDTAIAPRSVYSVAWGLRQVPGHHSQRRCSHRQHTGHDEAVQGCKAGAHILRFGNVTAEPRGAQLP